MTQKLRMRASSAISEKARAFLSPPSHARRRSLVVVGPTRRGRARRESQTNASRTATSGTSALDLAGSVLLVAVAGRRSRTRIVIRAPAHASAEGPACDQLGYDI